MHIQIILKRKYMGNNVKLKSRGIKTIRWTARLLSIFFIFLTLGFFIGEVMTEPQPKGSLPFINILVGILMLGGLALAWKWELYGGLISLVGFLGVIIVNPNAMTQPGAYIFPLTAILFLLCWGINRSVQSTETNVEQVE